jgi:hypothetical protein
LIRCAVATWPLCCHAARGPARGPRGGLSVQIPPVNIPPNSNSPTGPPLASPGRAPLTPTPPMSPATSSLSASNSGMNEGAPPSPHGRPPLSPHLGDQQPTRAPPHASQQNPALSPRQAPLHHASSHTQLPSSSSAAQPLMRGQVRAVLLLLLLLLCRVDVISCVLCRACLIIQVRTFVMALIV